MANWPECLHEIGQNGRKALSSELFTSNPEFELLNRKAGHYPRNGQKWPTNV